MAAAAAVAGTAVAPGAADVAGAVVGGTGVGLGEQLAATALAAPRAAIFTNSRRVNFLRDIGRPPCVLNAD